MTNDCIFCKIARKEIPSHIVFEDENSVAFLDLMPRSKGMCLVVPKKHYTEFDDDLDTSSKIFDTALIIGQKIKKSLEPLAVFFSVIRGQVPHFHIRVYPVFKDEIPLVENKPLEVTEEELRGIADKIKSVSVEWKREEPVEEIVEEVEEEEVQEEEPQEEKVEEESSEEVLWSRRELEIA